MKTKKLRDIVVSFFLVSTLGLATFIVSCSEDNITSVLNSDQSSPYHQHVHGQRGIVSTALTATFESVGSGAAWGVGKTVGDVGFGWALSSMGLVGASGPDWQEEFKTINNDLNEIIDLLAETNAELTEINNTLQILNCSVQNTSLQPETQAIQTYLGTYNTLMLDASEGDTNGQYVNFDNFANQVINGTSTLYSVPAALSGIEVNVNTGTGVIVSCLQPIPKPANGTFRGDSVYYVSAQSLLNYYYYYQTIGLGLLSEAYHWKAWVAAGGPGSGQGYSADSVQLICNNQNATFDCNSVIVQTNSVYNTLVTEFIETGAPYTGEDLLFQKNLNGENVVWVRSLEDYTDQSGANCTYPLSLSNLCGPTAGKFGSTLTYTTYYGTQNFIYPSLNELNGLVNPTPTTTGTIGYFLDSLGFENMNVNPPKILIADTIVLLSNYGELPQYYIDTMSVIPYISPSNPTFKTTTNQGVTSTRAIYSEFYDFVTIAMLYAGYEYLGSSPCAQNYLRYETFWTTTQSPSHPPWGGLPGQISGNIIFCQDDYIGQGPITNVQPFSWSAVPPGWSYYSTGSVPQNAYFIPVRTNFSGSAGCLAGYNNLNAGGFITKCGEDFQDYLNLNLPVPPTCSIPNVSPPCTTLP